MKTEKISEKFVAAKIINWLENKNWKISPITHKLYGVDIKANKNGDQYLIECKGETKSSNVSFNEIFGQIISRMIHKSDTNYYGIAFPDTKRYRDLIRNKLPDPVRKKLKLRIIFVNETGIVREIKSSQNTI